MMLPGVHHLALLVLVHRVELQGKLSSIVHLRHHHTSSHHIIATSSVTLVRNNLPHHPTHHQQHLPHHLPHYLPHHQWHLCQNRGDAKLNGSVLLRTSWHHLMEHLCHHYHRHFNIYSRDGRPAPGGTLPAGKGGFPAPPRPVKMIKTAGKLRGKIRISAFSNRGNQ